MDGNRQMDGMGEKTHFVGDSYIKQREPVARNFAQWERANERVWFFMASFGM